MTSGQSWSSPPAGPTLEVDQAAVWHLRADLPRPIETVLARYIGPEWGPIAVGRSETGKPEVRGSALAVSLAHSGDVALVAVARAGQVGVDVERVRRGAAGWALPAHALTPDERSTLEALPVSRRSEAFVRMWTRKEAVLKAAGVGLALDPRLVELDGRDVVAVPPELGKASDWTIVDLPLPGHAAALALRGSLSRLLLYDARDAYPPGE